MKVYRVMRVQRGEPIDRVWTLAKDGSPWLPDFAQWTVRARSGEDATELLTLDSDDNGLVLATGSMTWSVTAATVIESLPAGQWHHELVLLDGGRPVYTVFGPLLVAARTVVIPD